jgi:hypothetical protein
LSKTLKPVAVAAFIVATLFAATGVAMNQVRPERSSAHVLSEHESKCSTG